MTRTSALTPGDIQKLPYGWRALPAKSQEASQDERALRAWINGFIMRPSPHLDRAGAVCPYVRASICKNTLFVVTATPRTLTVAGIEAELRHRAAQFEGIAPSAEDAGAMLKAVLVCFPMLGPSAQGQVKTAAASVKPDMIRQGMTCGEFYPSSDDRSARSAKLRVAQAPIALVAMRYLTLHDQLFLRSQPKLFTLYQQWLSTKKTESEIT